MVNKHRSLSLIVIFGLFAICTRAEIKPAAIFGDHMVLQRDKPVPVWGTADPDEEVTVEFAGQTKTGKADKDGNWEVVLDPLETSAEGRVLRIGAKEFSDVLVGEVWLTAGQSNMGLTLQKLDEPVEADEPLLRIGASGKYGGVWFMPKKGTVIGPRNVKIQATPYYAGLELCRALKIPVGMLQAAVGGTFIEQWIPEADFRALQKEYPEVVEHRLAKKRPGLYGGCWLTKIEPIQPVAIRGVLWYQGEFNCRDGVMYAPRQRKLIKVLRRTWGDETLPFYYVQLPNGVAGIAADKIEKFVKSPVPGQSDSRARTWEGQARCLDVPHTGMIVTIDLGDVDDGNHPRNKIDVGRRLSRLMLAKTYGRDDLVATGPMYKSHEIKDGKFIVKFDYVGKGLMIGCKPYKPTTMKDVTYERGRSIPEPVVEVKDGKPQHFAICGEDRVWHWGDATIDPSTGSGQAGDTVVVSHPKVPSPVALRYAYSQWPTGANLYNRDGLPAAPFRTDDWDRKEERRNPPAGRKR